MGFQRNVYIAALIISAGASLSFGQVSGTWINPFGGTWQVGSNWDSNPVYPDGGGIATLGPTTWNTVGISSTGTVSLSQIVVNSPAKYSSSGNFTFAGPAVFDITGPAANPLFGAGGFNGHSLGNAYSTNGLVKNGPGAARIGLFNITGGITINDGTLLVGANTPFGRDPGTLTLNGGCLGITDLFPLIAQAIDVGAAGGIIHTNPTVSIGGAISGSGSLLLQGFSKNGFALLANNSFSGTLTNQGAVRLNQDGALPAVGQLLLYDNLVLDNLGTVVNANRLNDLAPITMRGGAIGGTLSGGVETIGTVTLAGGMNGLGSTNLAISAPGIIRQNRATLGVGSSVLLTGSLPVLAGSGTAGTPDVGILPWARRDIVNTVMPVTIDPGGQMRELTAAEYVTSPPGGVSTANVQLSADTVIGAPATVNSLQILAPGSGGITVSGSGTLTVSSGAVYFQRFTGGGTPVATISAPLDFGSAEGIIHTILPGSTGTFELSGPISGTNGLTIAGSVKLTGASTYTGATTIHGRVNVVSNVLAGVPGPLGADTSPVIIEGNPNGAGITFGLAGTQLQFDRDIIIHNKGLGSVTFGTPASPAAAPGATISGDMNIEGIVGLTSNTGTNNLIVSGDISGTGTLRSPNGVVLSGNNTFTGGIDMAGGNLGAGSDTAFGAGTFWAGDTPAIYAAGAPRTLANPFVIQFSLTVRGDQSLTLAGPIDLFGGGTRTINCTNTATTTLSGEVFNGGLNKTGAGLLQMKRVGLPTLSVSQGALRVIPNGTAASTSYVRSLSVATSGAGIYLDLTDNDLVVDYTGATVAPAIRAMLIDTRLRSSLADAAHGLGYADNAALGLSSFSGQIVDATSVLVKYTWFGDANLDGQVDISDLAALATAWQTAGEWINGDFDYSGAVDIADLSLLATNWQAGVAAPLAMTLEQALENLGLGGVMVPEPAGLALLALAAAIRRRR